MLKQRVGRSSSILLAAAPKLSPTPPQTTPATSSARSPSPPAWCSGRPCASRSRAARGELGACFRRRRRAAAQLGAPLSLQTTKRAVDATIKNKTHTPLISGVAYPAVYAEGTGEAATKFNCVQVLFVCCVFGFWFEGAAAASHLAAPGSISVVLVVLFLLQSICSQTQTLFFAYQHHKHNNTHTQTHKQLQNSAHI